MLAIFTTHNNNMEVLICSFLCGYIDIFYSSFNIMWAIIIYVVNRYVVGWLVGWCLTSLLITFMDVSATDRKPGSGRQFILFSKDSKGYFRCTQSYIVLYTTKPLINHSGTTGICPQESNPLRRRTQAFWFWVTYTLCMSPPWGRQSPYETNVSHAFITIL